jgi:cytochrome c1
MLARDHGCPACHVIPGVGPVAGQVGPPLAGFAARTYIAGRRPNRPDDLVAWLRNPVLIDPETAMPDVGLTEEEAKHVAAYLYTLEAEDA